MFKHKEHQPKLLRGNVVYKLTCLCDSIGRSCRNLRARLDDHNPDANPSQQFIEVKYLLENPTHFINLNKPEISNFAYNFKKLFIKETVLIHQLEPDIRVDAL